MASRATLLTKESIEGAQRKLAWFNLRPNGLYFDTGGLLYGSHTSYHVDGNVFRTSPASGGKAHFVGRMLPLNDFRGWHQFGIAVIDKQSLAENPPAKERDKNPVAQFAEVALGTMAADCINVVLEVVHELDLDVVTKSGLDAPPKAIESRLKLADLIIILTILGNDDELLVSLNDNGFVVNHRNARFSANAQGVTYDWEAYG